MEGGQMVWMVILTLANAVLLAFKIIEKRNGRKTETKNNPYPCRDHQKELIEHGEKLATLEEGLINIKDRLNRIENKINGLNR